MNMRVEVVFMISVLRSADSSVHRAATSLLASPDSRCLESSRITMTECDTAPHVVSF